MSEIMFNKYEQRGVDYHWQQQSNHPLKMNAYVKARYYLCTALLEAQIGPLKGQRILDFGCGDGVLTYALFKRQARAYGLDVAKPALQTAVAKHQSLKSSAAFCLASGYAAPYPGNSFDGIVSTEVIEHLQQPLQLLHEIMRLLKSGGVAVVSTPVRITRRPLDTMHVQEWYPEEYQSLIETVFPKAQFYYSHPLFWHELMLHNGRTRLFVNLLSFFYDPFRSMGKWRYPSLQYAIVHK
jgi:2-polyprenyl-3-methyl-5-hydroxy-6-metoxy-1,4-benzoquinol methylase